MTWHNIVVAAVFLLIGAYIGSKFPATNLIGRAVGA